MRERVRARFLELGRREDARAAEGASISTIHGFCGRLLRTHALSAGHRPRLPRARRARGRAGGGRRLRPRARGLPAGPRHPDAPDRLELVASYTPDGLRDMVRTAYSHLRSRGQRCPSLARGRARPRPAGEAGAAGGRGARGAGRARRGRGQETPLGRRARRSVAAWPSWRGSAGDAAGRPDAARSELELKGGNAKALATRGLRRVPRGARAPTATSASTPSRRATTPSCACCSSSTAAATSEAKQARSALDFEDLELLARDLLDGDEGLREQYSVALHARDGRRVPGREPAPERAARAGGARQPLPRRATRTSRSTASATPT